MNQSYNADRVRRVHLSHLLNHTSSPSLESFPASFVEPCAYWSHAEKASFFESLARHSRWKPDLIVEDIGGGKTIADVCSYIALLEQGSFRESQKRLKRDAYPIAHEVSEEWIAVENAAALELCGKEAEWREATLKRERARELKEVEKLLRRGSEIVRGSSSEGDDVSTTLQNIKRKRQASDQENEVWEERFKWRRQELRELWKREDMLSSLDGRYLKTMDKMLRALESAEVDKERAQLRAFASSKITHDGDARPVDQPSDFMSKVNEVDSQIDPLLLDMDRTNTNARPLSPHPSDIRRDPVALSSMGLLSVPLPPRAYTPGPSRVEGSERVSGAQSLVLDPVSQIPHSSPIPLGDIPSDLSPASRRRLRKRLWTRRKRAMESGIPVSEVPMDMTTLKRGRKAKHKGLSEAVKTKEVDPDAQVEVYPPGAPNTSLDPPNSQGHSEARLDARDETRDEESESTPKRKPYGWSKLMARQVSGETLRADGVDLFHLEKFVNIMSLLGHVHGLSDGADSVDELEGSSEGPSTLSYPFLRLLRACVTRFVTCLVAYAVLHKEVETRQKRRIHSIFRTGGAGEIRVENIREALLHMDKDATTKQFFTTLKRTVMKAAATQASSGRESEDDSDETGSSDDRSSKGEMEDDASSFTSSLSVRFNQATQHVFLPPCDGFQSSSPLYWNPSVLSAFGGKEGDTLLPGKIDEAGLLKELRAEEKLEEADIEASHIHERDLWMEIGVVREQQHGPVAKVSSKQINRLLQKPEGTETSMGHLMAEAGQSHSLRFRQPGGTVKSRVYIDSDEDL